MSQQDFSDHVKTRVSRHRAKVRAVGLRRVEVTVPEQDAALIKSIAERLRSGEEQARRVREVFAQFASPHAVRTGSDLVAFFRASPLVQEELDIERDRSGGRRIDLE